MTTTVTQDTAGQRASTPQTAGRTARRTNRGTRSCHAAARSGATVPTSPRNSPQHGQHERRPGSEPGRRGPPRPGRAARARRWPRIATTTATSVYAPVNPAPASRTSTRRAPKPPRRRTSSSPRSATTRRAARNAQSRGTAVSSHGVSDTVALPMPRWTPWASSHPSAPTENAVVHATVLCGLATQTSSTGRAMASSDRAAADGAGDDRPAAQRPPLQGAWRRRRRSGGGRDRAGSSIPSSSPVPASAQGGHAGRRAIAAESADARRAVPSGEANRPSYRLGVEGQPRSFMISRMRPAVSDGVLPT